MNTRTPVIATLELVARWGGDEDLDESRADLTTFRSQVLAAADLLDPADRVEILYDRILAEARSARALLSFISRARVLLLAHGLLIRGSVTSGSLRGRREEITVDNGAQVTWHAFGLDVSRAYLLQQYIPGIGIFLPTTFVRAAREDLSDLIIESEFVGGAPRAFPRRYWDVKLSVDEIARAKYEDSLIFLEKILKHSRSLGRQLIPLLITCIRSGWVNLGQEVPNAEKTKPGKGMTQIEIPAMDTWLLSPDTISKLKGIPGGIFPYLALIDWLFDALRSESPLIARDRVRTAVTTIGKYAFLRDSLIDAPETLLDPENRMVIDRLLRNPGSAITVGTPTAI